MRRYHVTTFGCQMNAHDSERIKGLLESVGLGEAVSADEADVVVFNTCTIREKPDTRLAAHLGNAAARKRENPELVVAVGGCYAEAQRERLFELYPFVDVAFGPGSIPHLADWLGAGGSGVERGRFGTHDHFAGHLPSHRERSFQAWVQVSMGCNSKCAYCVVPAVRGREQSRRPGDILAEVESLARDGVREITLLGQNVNSWGRDLAPGVTMEFGELLRACDAVHGIERIRFTSPHPKDFRAPVIAAIAGCDAVCEHVHLPVQSGSARVLKAMRRTYTPDRYLSLVTRLRGAIPDLALGTDIIVGFPGETEEDFLATLELVEDVRYDSAFTFVYSPRQGTEAAAMPGQVPDELKHERLERLVEVVQRIAWARNQERVGRTEEVLVEGPSRTDKALRRGRTRRNTTVNFTGSAAAGELVDVRIDGATSTTLRGAERAPVPV
ncbi:MAG TPA: tRNA (N6-isopentenyl adenosine(37)-C2)-methylthiotransferase MiaB [Gaiellaceae bacterium]|nr:tRNA (N6-isopentenyl adenosine(37)-C2)-methylthiotransferase MiaB [Gaiellaceae bacterium]